MNYMINHFTLKHSAQTVTRKIWIRKHFTINDSDILKCSLCRWFSLRDSEPIQDRELSRHLSQVHLIIPEENINYQDFILINVSPFDNSCMLCNNDVPLLLTSMHRMNYHIYKMHYNVWEREQKNANRGKNLF